MDYWKARQHMRYYSQVLNFARRYAPAGGSVIDIGGRDCDYITWFDWFERKVVLDLKPPPPRPGVEAITGDFSALSAAHHSAEVCADLRQSAPGCADRPFDLALCLQVLEHLAEPEPFCRKLLDTGRVLIVSVPYRWPKGLCSYHVQDPVDEAKLLLWMGRSAVDRAVVRDGNRERLVAVYR